MEALLFLGAIKIGYQPEKGADSPLSRPATLTLINSILLSFCLVSGNSFPTRAQTMTIICLSQAFVIASPFVVEPSSSSQSSRQTEAEYLITAVDFWETAWPVWYLEPRFLLVAPAGIAEGG